MSSFLPVGAVPGLGRPAMSEPRPDGSSAGTGAAARPPSRAEHEPVAITRILATAEQEMLLCDPRSNDTVARLLSPAADAWSARFPDLTSLPHFGKGAGEPGEKRPMSVCIATEDIVGPVRNGGIGTTYAALAEMLAAEGHDTTILYLRGKEVETGTLEHWIEHYAARGVHFVPVPNYAMRDGFRTAADRWLRAPYNMFRYLLDHPKDVVHVSEWRGSGYLSLLAKRQGIAFADTLFCVKTSSPWLWNRMYGSQSLDRIEDVTKIYAERKSVEMADVVIGGSLHLLRWMLSQGYAIPRERTFVQPNFVGFDHLKRFMGQRDLKLGSRMPVDEVVFFGRLEARKGLFTFCQAIRRLIRQGVALPSKISFMGKPGAKLTSRPNQTVIEFIESETATWPCAVEILTEFQQQEAIEYLLGGRRLAVMPSTIENSSMAVYEAAICGIPFIASDAGGTPELVLPADQAQVLCAAHPIPLATKIAEALAQGAYVATPSFDNDQNMAVWKGFHANLSGELRARLLPVHAVPSGAADRSTVAVCIYHTGDDEALRHTLDSLSAQSARPDEVLIAVDAPSGAASGVARELVARTSLSCRVLETFDFDAGLSLNALVEAATSDFVLLIWEGAALSPEALSALRRISLLSGADVLNFFYREIDSEAAEPTSSLKANIIGSLTETFFRKDLTVQPIFARREAFLAVGGFTTDYRVLGYDDEFLARAQLSGLRCETALVELATVTALRKDWLSRLCYDETVSQFRAIRPHLAAVPLALRDLLLMAKGMSTKAAGPKPRKELLPDSARLPGPKPKLAAKTADGAGAPVRKPAPNGAGATARGGAVDRLLRLLDDPTDVRSAKPSRSAQAVRIAARSKAVDQRASDQGAAAAEAAGSNGSKATRREAARANGRDTALDQRLLFVRNGVAYGWAGGGAPGDTVTVEATRDGRAVARAAADLTLDLRAPFDHPDVDRHGFALDLFPTWRDKTFGRGGATFGLRVVDTAISIVEAFRAFPPGARLQDCAIDGYCDPTDDGAVSGWAWYPGDAARIVELDVFVGETFAGRVRAQNHRDDLVQHGIGTGEHGFRLRLGRDLLSRRNDLVEVVVANAGVPLKRSPLRIVDGGLQPVLSPTTRLLRDLNGRVRRAVERRP